MPASSAAVAFSTAPPICPDLAVHIDRAGQGDRLDRFFVFEHRYGQKRHQGRLHSDRQWQKPPYLPQWKTKYLSRSVSPGPVPRNKDR